MTTFPPYQIHSPTSYEAAVSMIREAGIGKQKVYAFLRLREGLGATDEEMQRQLHMNPNTQRPRRIELERSGLVKDSGRTRKTMSGRAAVVWILAR